MFHLATIPSLSLATSFGVWRVFKRTRDEATTEERRDGRANEDRAKDVDDNDSSVVKTGNNDIVIVIATDVVVTTNYNGNNSNNQ